MGIIVALDIGISSVGWAVIDKSNEGVIEAGANLFPEATAAGNISRREMRQGRRLKRRQKTRIDDFCKLWEKYEFNSDRVETLNIPYVKVKALNDRVSENELFSILYSELKHRGISYLEDVEDEGKTSGEYAQALAINQKELESKYPCEIQKERLELYGKYRGQNEVLAADGELVSINNVFTTSAYRNEVIAILNKQNEFNKKITVDFINEYLLIFNRKRKYYEGPGNELSRTDYGIYSTKINAETGDYITEANIFEKLIGKCSIYPDELRAAAASYSAQEFNLLNDMNNLIVNGRKLSESEKKEIVDIVKSSDSVNMKKIIEKVIKEEIEELTGARVDKNDKEIFHSFSAYNKMRKALRNIGYDINSLGREELDEIGYILTINTDKESMLDAFNNSTLSLAEEVINCLIDIRRKNGTEFNKWHSFSLKIINELIPEMYEHAKEQMALLSEMGVFRSKTDEYKGLTYLPVDASSEELLNPVVRRSVRISFKIINALLKKYKEFDEIVIEMPRDKNSDEEKKRIKDWQRSNEKEIQEIEKNLAISYNLILKKSDYGNQKKLGLKLKLWNEQNGICLYSGKAIDPRDIVKNPDLFEIDHIIPRSISLDDSRNNKVLVYRSENQKKGNTTPYYYLTHANSSWTYEHFKAKVLELSKKKEYGLSRKKVQNLLFEKNITKIEVVQGFISRNLNDTRYASRVILNTLQSFFRANEKDTKIKVIRGSYTHQMRENMKLDKNRDESYSHHAVDAMLIAYSQMGYESFRKLQGAFIDFETGEILDQRMYDSKMTDDAYVDCLYGKKWSLIRNNITEAEKNVRYWYYIDKKSNRALCNQTIRGSREYDGKIYKINKFDIRTKEGVALFKKLAFDEKQREHLLVYKNDIQTFNNLIQIYNDYSDATNPFVQYEKETGDFVRKYAKKHNGPRIGALKYTDGEVGSCIDISHKYGFERNSKKVFLESLVPYRMDVYYNNNDHLYYLVGLKQSDVKCEAGISVIDEDAYARVLVAEKMINEGQRRDNLQELGYEFVMSFYKNELIEYEKNGEIFTERFLSRTMPKKRNYIETKPIHKSKFENSQNLVGLSKTTSIRKIRLDILGNRFYCEKEEFNAVCE